ncbi:Transcription initiation factor IIB (TFIIB) [Halomicrobium zhouii]|uniref:Transcription initiation factor IIB n=1 Tax=Halomicrobium zhouii TaxID=767519 RepID=A0A1I6L1D7_9EURY|nr:transcription initiation factor IIB [Halomicrobium zhouii]SFR97313.1 Transcription initiation factor IIB (TFIIB) [Halomicrobium zhouii]
MSSRDIYERGFDESTGKTNETACPDCDGDLRTIDGEQCCEDCGLIVEACRLDRRGPRTFPGDQEQKRRTGGPRTVTRHDRGLSTEIGRKRDARGNAISGKKRRQLARLRREHDRARFRSKRERNLAHGLGGIDRLTAQLDLSKSIQEQASSLFRTAQDANLLMGRSIESIAAGSVYAACRINDVPRTIDEIASVAAVGREKVSNGYMVLNRELDLPVPPQQPQEYIPRLVSAFDLPCRTERRAREIATEGVEAGLATGVNPAGFAASCVAVAAATQGIEVIQLELAEEADVSPTTVREHRDTLWSFLGK